MFIFSPSAVRLWNPPDQQAVIAKHHAASDLTLSQKHRGFLDRWGSCEIGDTVLLALTQTGAYCRRRSALVAPN